MTSRLARARLDAYSHSVRDKDAPTDTHVRCNGCGAHWKINTLPGCHECDISLQDMKDAVVYEEIEAWEIEE